MFAFLVAHENIQDYNKPLFITKCCQRQNWPKWKESIQAELSSLRK